jgi:hypothetical protein
MSRRVGEHNGAVESDLLDLDEAADLIGMSRGYVARQAELGTFATCLGPNGVRQVGRGVLTAWHKAERDKQRVAMTALSADLERELRR